MFVDHSLSFMFEQRIATTFDYRREAAELMKKQFKEQFIKKTDGSVNSLYDSKSKFLPTVAITSVGIFITITCISTMPQKDRNNMHACMPHV